MKGVKKNGAIVGLVVLGAIEGISYSLVPAEMREGFLFIWIALSGVLLAFALKPDFHLTQANKKTVVWGVKTIEDTRGFDNKAIKDDPSKGVGYSLFSKDFNKTHAMLLLLIFNLCCYGIYVSIHY